MAENTSSHHPMGNRFHPTEREVLKYLVGFVRDEPLPPQHEVMQVADLYADKEPWQIFEAYDHGNNTTRYFITPQKKEKPTWKRVSRTVGKGTWKPQSKGREVFDDKGRLMGYMKSLKYIPANKSSNNVNGEWLMTEYSLYDHYLNAREIKNKGFVICKIKKKGKPGDKKKGNNIDEVVNDENMRDIEEFINSVLQEDVQAEDNGIRSNGIAKSQENNIIQYVEGDQVRDHVLGLLDSPEDIVDVNDHEEYVEDCLDLGDEVQVHLLEEYIDSVQQSEDVQAEDSGIIMSNDIIAKEYDQENIEYQVEDHQRATLWASADDVDLDTINFC